MSGIPIVNVSGPPMSMGQKTMANSLPIVIASDQGAIPVSGSFTVSAGTITAITEPLPAGTNLIGKVSIDQTTPGTTNLVAANITKIGGSAVAIGQAAMAASLPVVIASNQTAVHFIADSGTITTVSAVTAITSALPAGTNLLGKVGIDQTTHGTTNLVAADVTKVGGSALALGQAVMTASLPVVIASNQAAVHFIADSGTITAVTTVTAVTAITNALPAGTNLLGKVGIDQTTHGTTNLVAADVTKLGGIAINLGAGTTGTGTQRVVSASDDPVATVSGATTDAAVSSDAVGTISAKLRGLVKILADIWDSTNHLLHTNLARIGGTAFALGQTTKSASVPITIASDQVALTGTLVNSTAYEKSHVLKSSSGKLISLFGYNSGIGQFIQLHNTTSVPADTAVPVATFWVPATSNFSLSIPLTGLDFTTGICVCNSSTGPTKTLGATSDCFFTAEVTS